MGALFGGNAGRQWGYKIGDKIVPPSIDRIDGGGPGRSGPRFEGGGLLSDIGNALMRPYGYRDRQAAMQAVRHNARQPGLLTTAPTYRAPAPSAASPYFRDEDQVMGQSLARRPTYFGGEGALPSVPPMPQAYFDRLVEWGVNPDAITPVGQPMTMDEFSSMSKYMAGSPTGVWPDNVTRPDAVTGPNYYSGPTYEAFRAADAHSGGMADLRRAAGTPAASLSAVERDPYFQYLVNAGVSDFAAQKLADDTSWGGMQLRKAFETRGAIPDRPLSILLKRHGR